MSRGFRLRGFRFSFFQRDILQVSIDDLLHLRHQRSQGLVARVETIAKGCACRHRHLVRVPSLG